jgi:hypothetical protein
MVKASHYDSTDAVCTTYLKAAYTVITAAGSKSSQISNHFGATFKEQ